MGIFLVTFLFATSYYTGYSYIEPFLQKVAGLSDNWVTTTLTIFGAAGLLGSFLFSHYYDKNKYLFVKLVMISVAAALHNKTTAICAFIISDIKSTYGGCFIMCILGYGSYGI